jgi:hypothetical protein
MPLLQMLHQRGIDLMPFSDKNISVTACVMATWQRNDAVHKLA